MARTPNAYILFLQDIRPSLVNSDMSMGDMSKTTGERWKALSEAEKQPYKEKAQELAAAAEQAKTTTVMNSNVNVSRPRMSGIQSTAMDSVTAIPPPPAEPIFPGIPNSFVYYVSARNAEAKEKKEAPLPMEEFRKVMRDDWAKLSDQEKEIYTRMREEDKAKRIAQYKVEYRNYLNHPSVPRPSVPLKWSVDYIVDYFTAIRAGVADKVSARFDCENCGENVKKPIATILDTGFCCYACTKQAAHEQAKATWMSRYNEDNPMKCAEIFERFIHSSYKRKIFITPKGREIVCQGDEPYCLADLIRQGVNEDTIVTGAGNVPDIRYNFMNKQRRYITDIYIPDQNLMIEVKSTWHFVRQIEMNEAKKQASIDAGYAMQWFIYDDKKRLAFHIHATNNHLLHGLSFELIEKHHRNYVSKAYFDACQVNQTTTLSSSSLSTTATSVAATSSSSSTRSTTTLPVYNPDDDEDELLQQYYIRNDVPDVIVMHNGRLESVPFTDMTPEIRNGIIAQESNNTSSSSSSSSSDSDTESED